MFGTCEEGWGRFELPKIVKRFILDCNGTLSQCTLYTICCLIKRFAKKNNNNNNKGRYFLFLKCSKFQHEADKEKLSQTNTWMDENPIPFFVQTKKNSPRLRR